MRILQGPKQPVERVLFAPDCSGLAIEMKGRAVYWPTFGATQPHLIKSLLRDGFDFAADGKHFLAYTNRGLRVYAPGDSAGKRLPTRSIVANFACSPTSPVVAVRMMRGSQLFGWRVEPDASWTRLWEGTSGSYFRPQFSADGTRVFQHLDHRFTPNSSATTDVIEGYDPQSGQLVERVPCRGLYFYGAVFSPDIQFIANVFAKDIAVFARDSEWQHLLTLHNDTRKHFTGIAFHPSGRYLAATSNDATVRFYDTTSWEVATTFTWDIGKMRSIAFSPDGTLAAAGSDSGKVVVWDVDV